MVVGTICLCNCFLPCINVLHGGLVCPFGLHGCTFDDNCIAVYTQCVLGSSQNKAVLLLPNQPRFYTLSSGIFILSHGPMVCLQHLQTIIRIIRKQMKATNAPRQPCKQQAKDNGFATSFMGFCLSTCQHQESASSQSQSSFRLRRSMSWTEKFSSLGDGWVDPRGSAMRNAFWVVEVIQVQGSFLFLKA